MKLSEQSLQLMMGCMFLFLDLCGGCGASGWIQDYRLQLMILFILFTLSYKSCSGGMYRKLHQVMQTEKEREMDSLKNASAETSFKGISETEHSIIYLTTYVSK